ncbi:hypothetical protein [Mycoplasma sp. P36-A1]|uniref:hypothetical protein n=1 Tax=Mycoplasma sp. P36-A1 TaxID=3252900 RepID=UPI003C2DBD5A
MNLFLRRLLNDIKLPFFLVVGLHILSIVLLLSSSSYFINDFQQITIDSYIFISAIVLILVSFISFSASIIPKRRYQSLLWPLSKRLQFFLPLVSYYIFFAVLDLLLLCAVAYTDAIAQSVMEESFLSFSISVILAKYVISTYIFMLFHISYDLKSSIVLIIGSVLSFNYYSLMVSGPISLLILSVIFILISIFFEVMRYKWHWQRTTKFLCYLFLMFLLTNIGNQSFLGTFLYSDKMQLTSLDYILSIVFIITSIIIVYSINEYKFKPVSTVIFVILPIIASSTLYYLYRSPVITQEYNNDLVIKDVQKDSDTYTIRTDSNIVMFDKVDKDTRKNIIKSIKSNSQVVALSLADSTIPDNGMIYVMNNFTNHKTYEIKKQDFINILLENGFYQFNMYELIDYQTEDTNVYKVLKKQKLNNNVSHENFINVIKEKYKKNEMKYIYKVLESDSVFNNISKDVKTKNANQESDDQTNIDYLEGLYNENMYIIYDVKNYTINNNALSDVLNVVKKEAK